MKGLQMSGFWILDCGLWTLDSGPLGESWFATDRCGSRSMMILMMIHHNPSGIAGRLLSFGPVGFRGALGLMRAIHDVRIWRSGRECKHEPRGEEKRKEFIHVSMARDGI